MARLVSLALVQAAGRPADDLEGFAADARRVARDFPEANLIAYPELHLSGDGGATTFEGAPTARGAEPLTRGPRHELLSRLAAELGVWLCPGSVFELDDDGRIFNTAVVYDPNGDLIASYRKIFPWRPYEQASPGDSFVVFDMARVGRVGLSICFDSWFPETTRHLAWMGAELILNVVKTPTVDREQEQVIARANAIVNQVFFASLNAAAPSGIGHSLLVDPEGRVMTSAPTTQRTVVTSVIDLDAVATTRRYGTAGLTRPWDQFQPGDRPISLPLYDGRMDPTTWKPQTPD